MKSSRELKDMILRRMEERQQEQEREELVEPSFAEDEVKIPELDELDAEELVWQEEEDDINHTLIAIEEEGFASYVTGKQSEENPYMAENEILAEAWNEGWISAHVQTCTTNILLTAKRLVEAETPEVAEQEMANLEEAVNLAKEALDFEEAEMFWKAVLEGGETSE